MAKRNNASSLDSTETQVKIIDENDQEVEVYRLQSYGVGIDCHSGFIAICVYVRRNMGVYRYSKDFDTDWESLKVAKQWVLDIIRDYSDPVLDLSLPLHYVIEATSTYHMPIVIAWKGTPSVINPMLAGATNARPMSLAESRRKAMSLQQTFKNFEFF